MKRLLSILLCAVLFLGLMPDISFAEDFRIAKSDDIEKYSANEKLVVNKHPSFCGFGSGSYNAVITDTFSRSGSKSVMMADRLSNNGTIKIHDLFGRKLKAKDEGKTFDLSFYVYADKNSGVYKQNAESVKEGIEDCLYTEEELKESTGTVFSVYLTGPDGSSYKYRKGTVSKKDYQVPWNEWTKITYSYTVKSKYLPTDSTEELSDPYLDSVRVCQGGDYSINQGICDTFYIDDVEVTEQGVTNFQAAMIQDCESLAYNEKFDVHTHPVFCNFGANSKSTAITSELTHTGTKALKQSGRASSGATVKIHNLFGKELTEDDLGKVFLITVYVYADKESGVYKQSVSGLSAEEKAKYRYTEEELKSGDGCEFTICLAGPDANKYQHRKGIDSVQKYRVPWNEWTPLHFYYTVEEKYLSNGSDEDLSNPYIDSIRVGQNVVPDDVNSALVDTMYIDDITVNEVGVVTSSSFYEGKMYVLNQYIDNFRASEVKAFVTEYDSWGKLIGVTIQSAPIEDGKFINHFIECEVKSDDSKMFTFVWSGLNPISPTKELRRIYDEDNVVIPVVGEKRAQEMLQLSKAEYKDALSFDERIDKDNEYFQAVSDTYVSVKSPDSKAVFDKYLNVSSEYASIMKFDISQSSKQSFSHAYFSIYSDALKTPGKVELYAINSDWDEETVTYNKISSNMKKLCELDVGYKDLVFYFDISSYANEMVRKNADAISLCMKTTSGDISFVSWRSTQKSYKAALIFEGIGMKEGEKKISSFDYSNYVTVDKKKNRGTKGSYIPTPTRILSSLTDYTPVEEAPELNKYGSPITDEKYEATGFFYMKQIDGRWWFIDPEGYKQLHIGVGVVRPEKNNEKEINAFNAKYGTDENWANMVVDELRPYGFNGCGFVGKYKLMLDATEAIPLNQVGFVTILSGYDSTYNDNVMSVFDPAFEVKADARARNLVDKYADNPHVMGWSFDNEPPANDNMLESYLTTDRIDPKTAYSYYTAWAWLRQRHGKNATINDITPKDKTDWVEFVYDRYMNVCVTAIKKYDSNHLIFGPKLDKPNRGSFRGVSKWVDVVCYDYYGNAWTAEHSQMDSFYRWSGRPLINAEWYAKGADACTEETGLTNFSGVGYQATTQVGRGHYYQNFVINMLESKAFIGWHWFRYIDNPGDDKYDEGADTNANKGLYTNFYTPWTELLSQMKLINENVYSMMDYFDK